jgi:hypothetical protein
MQHSMSHTLRTSAIRAAFATVALLLIPLLAMYFTDEVNWDLADFLVAGTLLFSAGFAWQLAAARTGDGAYRTAMGIAIVALLLLVWGNLAVGIIGAEDNPANRLYFAVPVVGFLGAALARFRPLGMALALIVSALAQVLITLAALGSGLGGSWSEPLEVVWLNGFFVLLYCGSACLFWRSARGSTASR